MTHVQLLPGNRGGCTQAQACTHCRVTYTGRSPRRACRPAGQNAAALLGSLGAAGLERLHPALVQPGIRRSTDVARAPRWANVLEPHPVPVRPFLCPWAHAVFTATNGSWLIQGVRFFGKSQFAFNGKSIGHGQRLRIR